MGEVTVNVSELEAKFEKKITAKEAEIKDLETKLNDLNKSVTKASVDAKDSEIKTLTEAMSKVVENEKAAKTLAEQRNEELTKLQSDIQKLNETVKAKSDELDKVTKELNEIKAKEVTSSRIKAYRDKSKDSTSKDEDLAKKFAGFSNETFETMIELVKPVEEPKVTETEEQKTAKALAAVKEARETKPNDGAPAPTSSEAPKDGLRSTAAKLIASIFTNETKKE